MADRFKRIKKHLYERRYKTERGEWSTCYYARFTCKLKGKARCFPLGSDLDAAKERLDGYEADNLNRKDFDAKEEGAADAMTVATWADAYFNLDEVKKKRSLGRDRWHVGHITRILGGKALTALTRDDLFHYWKTRAGESIDRKRKTKTEPSKKVSDGTIRNEMACLRRMLNLAEQRGVNTSRVLFRGAMPKAAQRERVLSPKEAARLFLVMPTWLRRIVEISRETSLCEGDLLRLTDAMIDEEAGEIVPAGGRIKTGVRQAAPLTARAAEILAEIRAERRAAKANMAGPIFRRDDGQSVTKNVLIKAMRRACKRAGVVDFRFHDLRHTAKTEWARRGISADAAMLAAGHKSAQMHLHYIHLQRSDVAKAFGIVTPLQHESAADKTESATA